MSSASEYCKQILSSGLRCKNPHRNFQSGFCPFHDPATRKQCQYMIKGRKRCQAIIKKGSDSKYCSKHTPSQLKKPRCHFIREIGRRCSNKIPEGEKFCYAHKKQEKEEYEEEEKEEEEESKKEHKMFICFEKASGKLFITSL